MQLPGRPRQFDEEETLSKIMQVFWEHGYEATGLSDIIKVTGLGKASLYKAFGNKQSMYLKALTQYEQVMVDGAVGVLRSPDLAPLDRIDAFVSSPIIAVQNHSDRRGCFLCNAAADRASLDPDTGALVRRGYDKMRAAIAHALSQARPNLAPERITARSEGILTLYSGLRVMSRAGTSGQTLMAAKDEVMHTLVSAA